MTLEKAWEDWPDTDIEAGIWVKENKYMQGYADGKFNPKFPMVGLHFCMILENAGICVSQEDKNKCVSRKMTIGDAQKYLPGTAYLVKPTDELTRFRFAVMLYRWFNFSDEAVIEKLEQWFKETNVTWNGVTRQPRLLGHAKFIVEDSRKTGIPIWLALGQCWRESQWFTTGLSVDYNCGWGIKDTKGWGEKGNPEKVKGYTNYISVEEAIHAYFKLMSSPIMPYAALIKANKIQQALNIYAPASDGNNETQHYMIVLKIKESAEKRGIK